MRAWEKRELGDVCAFVRGPFGGSLKKSYFVNAGFAVYEQQHAIYDQFDDVRYFIGEDKFAEMARFELRPGDLVMSCSGTMGRVAIVPSGIRRGIINQALLKLTPKQQVNAVFLKLWMQSDIFQDELRKQSGGAAIENVASVKILKSIKIDLPPLEEQQRIVAALEEAFAAIATATANAEKNLANARELFEAAFRERFDHVGNGWKTYRLPDLAENWDYLRRPVTKSDRVPGDIPYYGASGRVDSVRDHLFDDDLLLISEDGANLLMRTYPIAFSIAGKTWVNNHAHILKFEDMATQRLVEYYFNSISVAPWVSGMAQPKLNQKALNRIPVPLPPEDEREKLVMELDELAGGIERLEANQEDRLATLTALKQSILHRAFTGELTAATPELIPA